MILDEMLARKRAADSEASEGTKAHELRHFVLVVRRARLVLPDAFNEVLTALGIAPEWVEVIDERGFALVHTIGDYHLRATLMEGQTPMLTLWKNGRCADTFVAEAHYPELYQQYPSLEGRLVQAFEELNKEPNDPA